MVMSVLSSLAVRGLPSSINRRAVGSCRLLETNMSGSYFAAAAAVNEALVSEVSESDEDDTVDSSIIRVMLTQILGETHLSPTFPSSEFCRPTWSPSSGNFSGVLYRL